MRSEDVGEVQFEQARQVGGGRTVLVGGRRLTDHPDPDPAAQAAADVERLLSRATGLQRIVEVARAVDGGGPGAAPLEPEAPGGDPGPVEGTSTATVDGTAGLTRSESAELADVPRLRARGGDQ